MGSARTVVVIGTLCVALFLCLSHVSGDVSITEEKCRQIKQSPPGNASFAQQDLCSLCDAMVLNRYHWNWASHPNSLCDNRVPKYLQEMCEYFACLMLDCSDFQAGSCEVSRGFLPGTQREATVTITPCPAEYMCFTCLPEFFKSRSAGCLDGLYDRI